MKINSWIKGTLATAGAALGGLILATVADAANPETIGVDVTWAAPITITSPSNMDFGLLSTGMANGNTVTINPDSTFSDPQSNVVGGTPLAAASMTVGATASQALTIVIDTIVNGTYYTLGSFVCNYNNGTDTACSSYNPSSVASATLNIGATLTGAGGAVAGADAGSFNVTITYQ